MFQLEHTSAEQRGPVRHVFQVCPIKTVSIQTADNEPVASSERPIKRFNEFFFTQLINIPPLAPSICLCIQPCFITSYPALLVILAMPDHIRAHSGQRRSLPVQVDSLRQYEFI